MKHSLNEARERCAGEESERTSAGSSYREVVRGIQKGVWESLLVSLSRPSDAMEVELMGLAPEKTAAGKPPTRREVTGPCVCMYMCV